MDSRAERGCGEKPRASAVSNGASRGARLEITWIPRHDADEVRVAVRSRGGIAVIASQSSLSPAGWVDYATWGGGVADRADFPMRANWIHFNGSPAAEQVDPARARAADEASAENLADPQFPEFVEANGLMRGADSFSLDAQAARIAYGFQYLQTDHPWLQLRGRGQARPFRREPAPSS